MRDELAIFDVDGTLFSYNTGRAFMIYLYQKRLITLSELLSTAAAYYLFRRRTIETMLAREFPFLSRFTVAQMRDLVAAFYAERLGRTMSPRMRQVIGDARRKGMRTLILSASPRILLEPIRRILGIDDLIGSELGERAGRLTGRYTLWNYGTEKLSQLQAYLAEHRLSPKKLYFYSDSISDLPVFSHVTDPVAVNPDRALKGLAQQQGWPILCE